MLRVADRLPPLRLQLDAQQPLLPRLRPLVSRRKPRNLNVQPRPPKRTIGNRTRQPFAPKRQIRPPLKLKLFARNRKLRAVFRRQLARAKPKRVGRSPNPRTNRVLPVRKRTVFPQPQNVPPLVRAMRTRLLAKPRSPARGHHPRPKIPMYPPTRRTVARANPFPHLKPHAARANVYHRNGLLNRRHALLRRLRAQSRPPFRRNGTLPLPLNVHNPQNHSLASVPPTLPYPHPSSTPRHFANLTLLPRLPFGGTGRLL